MAPALLFLYSSQNIYGDRMLRVLDLDRPVKMTLTPMKHKHRHIWSCVIIVNGSVGIPYAVRVNFQSRQMCNKFKISVGAPMSIAVIYSCSSRNHISSI